MINTSAPSMSSFSVICPSQLDLHRPPSISPIASPRRPATITASYSTTTEKETSTHTSYNYSPYFSVVTAPPSPSLYDVLGVGAYATGPEIKSAYRNLARVYHPDVASGDTKEKSADQFMRIQDAYSTLSDPTKREEYDRTLLLANSTRKIYTKSASFSSYSSRRGYPVSPRTSPVTSGLKTRNWETDQCW
ncbi:Chaperone protein dnaJ [Zostera marina]|uniref:Chaperone protein dnaJ n=1 Tax=Zostera marina TaxID=29655 RepID=A0A0K9PAR4_ZOSMR|nr:Chaperone protein dnaJ [Zostera marina]